MTSKLSIYWSVEHRYQHDYAYFQALQPSVFKIMDGGQPDYQWAKDNLRDCLYIARDWALSEQHDDMLRDPVGTGDRHAHEWNEHQARLGFDRDKTLVLGINEPHVWDAGVPEALRKYTITLCESAHALGLRVGAMQLGVGWPGNNGPDTPPDWSPFAGVEQAIRAGNHALVCHEYWADNGPGENWGWWAGRTLKCPWQVPIVIGECGIDYNVKATVTQDKRAWRTYATPEQYAAQLWEYANRCGQDPRFVGACVFASDFQAHEWEYFDYSPAYPSILAHKADTPSTIFVPTISTGDGPTQPQPSGIIDPLVARAILQIESGGQAFGPDGKPTIRFEAHIFRHYLANDAVWADYFQTDTQKPWTNQMWRQSPGDPWRQLHTGSQADEWAAFRFALSLGADAAAKAISMGAPQIMGFNAERVGWPNAAAMLNAFQDSAMQTLGFINYVLSDPALAEAMRDKDFRTIAKLYNGSGAVDSYSALLQRAYAQQMGAK